jgi:SOS-response transcriptional repressor LexA
MHETVSRLYEAARILRGLEGSSAVARALNVAPQTVTNWQARGMSHSGILLAAERLGCSPLWLKTGAGPMVSSTEEGSEKRFDTASETNVTPLPSLRDNLIPVVSWVQAGAWADIVDNFAPGDAEEMVFSTVKKKRHTFALRVRGDSMVNPTGSPSFPEGMTIIVEPDMSALPGDFVIVRQSADAEATFKQLVRDGDRLYLRPLNPRYPILDFGPDAVIVGVVRSAEIRFR